jgi:hemoglobin/transferrin/lactoferrin receptor protein
MDHIPPAYGMIGCRYNRKKLFTECTTQFNTKKKLNEYSPSGEDNLQYATPNGLPGWWTFNLKSSYEYSHHLHFQAGIENIFDVLYRTFASGYNAPGRNITISVRLQ